MNLHEKNIHAALIPFATIIILLSITLSPLVAQDNSPDRWQTVDRWVGTIAYELYNNNHYRDNSYYDVEDGGERVTVIYYNIELDRHSPSDYITYWSGKATGYGSFEEMYEAEKTYKDWDRELRKEVTKRYKHTWSCSGQGSLEDELTLYLRRDLPYFVLKSHHRLHQPQTKLHGQEKVVEWVDGRLKSSTAKERDCYVQEFSLLRNNLQMIYFDHVDLEHALGKGFVWFPEPESGMGLSGSFENKYIDENFLHRYQLLKITISLHPEGYEQLAQEEEDFSCISPSSLILCQAQAVVIEEPIPGTSFQLVYRSDRFIGGCTENTWDARIMHLGGWTINSHHFFDPVKRVLHLGCGNKQNIPKGHDINSPYPGHLIASEDARLVFHFDEGGRHLRTLHPLTGATLLTFHYDNGMLARIEDFDGYSVTVDRNDYGAPSSIRAPFGQVTRLLLNQNGFVGTLNKHGGESVRFDYDSKGLLTSRRDARGYRSSYQYNDCGRLERANDAAGAYRTLNRQDVPGGYKVTEITASGKKSEYTIENQGDEGSRWINILPGGIKNTISYNNSDYRVHNFHDGTKVEVFKIPDPRFGMQAPCEKTIVTYPDGTKHVTEVERIALLSNPNNPFSLIKYTEVFTINGKTYTDVYEANSRTLIRTSPTGRQTVMMFDEIGRIVIMHVPDRAPVSFKYDRGQLVEMSQGSGQNFRRATMKYNQQGLLQSITDPLMQVTSFEYDLPGRVKKLVSPSAAETLFDYDVSGNLAGITPPGKPRHSFEHNQINLLARYTPPSIQGTSNSIINTFNSDRQPTGVDYAGDGQLAIGYDNSGRINEVQRARGIINHHYDGNGRLERIIFPQGTIGYIFSGFLNETETWSGMISGEVNHEFGKDFLLKSLTVNRTQKVDYHYDDDGLITKAGKLRVQRDDHSGLIEETNLGGISDKRIYNEFGEIELYTATYNGQVIFETTYKHDALGRIASLEETIEGETISKTYTYDIEGRVEKIFVNDAVIAQYTYDTNGNRIQITTPDGSLFSTYDDQDRLISSGNTTFTYRKDGHLKSKAEAGEIKNLQYDEFGNLLKVVLPDGQTIEYVVDGKNRRIGNLVNGKIERGFLYKDELKPVAELDQIGNLKSVFIYGTATNIPDYIEKDDKTFRVITDHLGSVRLVVDILSGKVEHRIDYDAFGVVTEDTNPGFQPFGFAGGIYDNHTGFVRFGARDYDPSNGRWTAKDPILFNGGDTNLYAYVGNDPVNWIDKTGQNRNQASDSRGSSNSNVAKSESSNFLVEFLKSAACAILPGPVGPMCTVGIDGPDPRDTANAAMGLRRQSAGRRGSNDMMFNRGTQGQWEELSKER